MRFILGMRCHANFFEWTAALVFELLKVRRGEAGRFFELIGQVCYAAVVHFPGDFRNAEFAVHD